MSDAKESKISLKGSDFSIKPIKKIISANFITPEFLEACQEIAEYYLSAPGSALKDFVPQAILEGGFELKISKAPEQVAVGAVLPVGRAGNGRDIVAIQSPTEERIQHYKSIVREELAKNKSVFFMSADHSRYGKKSPLNWGAE